MRAPARLDVVNAALVVGGLALYLGVGSLFRDAATCPRGEGCWGPGFGFIIFGIPALVAGTICLASIAVRESFLRRRHLLPVSIVALIVGVVLLVLAFSVEHPPPM
jgi:hypothetical protein